MSIVLAFCFVILFVRLLDRGCHAKADRKNRYIEPWQSNTFLWQNSHAALKELDATILREFIDRIEVSATEKWKKIQEANSIPYRPIILSMCLISQQQSNPKNRDTRKTAYINCYTTPMWDSLISHNHDDCRVFCLEMGHCGRYPRHNIYAEGSDTGGGSRKKPFATLAIIWIMWSSENAYLAIWN